MNEIVRKILMRQQLTDAEFIAIENGMPGDLLWKQLRKIATKTRLAADSTPSRTFASRRRKTHGV